MSAIIDRELHVASTKSVTSPVSEPSCERSTCSSLSDEQVKYFWENGFVVVENVTTREEVAEMREVYDRLFASRRGWQSGDLFDFASPDDPNKALSLPQLLWPSRHEPYFQNTITRTNTHAIARQLLGPKAENMNEHAILKPAFTGGPTPWHQDESFNNVGSGFRESIAMWMPLQDVTEANGCLWYIPKSNLGPLYPHRSPNNDPTIHGLVTTPPNESLAVPVCMPAGAVLIHHSMTLHSAGANIGPEPRRAYVLGFGVKTERNLLAREYPWNLEKRTARESRYLQSLSKRQRFTYQLKKWLHGHRPWK